MHGRYIAFENCVQNMETKPKMSGKTTKMEKGWEKPPKTFMNVTILIFYGCKLDDVYLGNDGLRKLGGKNQ